MAGSPQSRKRFTTDKNLLKLATSVPLRAPRDRVVLYAEDVGTVAAAAFVKANAGYARLDELLQATPAGRQLWDALVPLRRSWSDVEEIWWELSWRLARSASGIVNVFGPARLVSDRPLSEFRHKYSTGCYANTVFEKVELPELEANPNVTRILYNGKPFA